MTTSAATVTATALSVGAAATVTATALLVDAAATARAAQHQPPKEKRAQREKAAGGGGDNLGAVMSHSPPAQPAKRRKPSACVNVCKQYIPFCSVLTPPPWGVDDEELICNGCLSKPTCLYNDSEADYCAVLSASEKVW
jgi:hypothetical protein